MEVLKKAIRTSEFWLSLAMGVAAVLERFGVPGAQAVVEKAWPIVVVIGQRILSKSLKPGQVPFQVVAALLGGALLAAPAVSRAADLSDVVGIYGAVNGAWTESHADLELGGTARASLSPHLSAVGGAVYGFDGSYVRWNVGARFTATDVDDPSFSVGLGIQYHGSSEAISGPRDEWAPDASFGWVPFAEQPRLSVVGLACYGLTSESARATLGLRYKFNL